MRATSRASALSWSSVAMIAAISSAWVKRANWVAIWNARCPGSTHGSLRPHPAFIPYAAAKAGLNTMTEALAQAFGPTVRVNTLMPGPFLTDIAKSWNLGDANPFSHFALQRAGNPNEIVGAALFLMSDASSYTTGSILRADGGIP